MDVGGKMHCIKTWPEFFRAVVTGDKTAELRKNDRGYEVGDCLCLQEFNPNKGDYTGEMVCAWVTHIIHGPAFGLADGHCMMSLRVIRDGTEQPPTPPQEEDGR
jgi:hypothetical protein